MGSHVQLEPGTPGFLVFVTMALLGTSISSWSTKPEEQMDGHKGEVKVGGSERLFGRYQTWRNS